MAGRVGQLLHRVHDYCTHAQHSPWHHHRAGAVLDAGDAATKVMAPEQSFTTSPAVGAASQLRFIAWADSGQATYDGTNEYDYSEVGAEPHRTHLVLQNTQSCRSFPYHMCSLAWQPVNHQAAYRCCLLIRAAAHLPGQ